MSSRHHPSTPASHYEQALRWLELAEATGAEFELRDLAAQIALVLAVLAQTPRRNVRGRGAHQRGDRPTGQLPPSLSWGDDGGES
jgi:hypothetical protein